MRQVHAVVWLDHREARIASFSMGTSTMFEVHSNSPERRIHHNIHHKANEIGSGKAADDHDFFDEVIASLTTTREVLIAGPGNAKTAFETYVRSRNPGLAKRIVGVETLAVQPMANCWPTPESRSVPSINYAGTEHDVA